MRRFLRLLACVVTPKFAIVSGKGKNIEQRIVVHTEDLNSYGFWLKTSGVDLSHFKKNPVVLYNHNSYGRNQAPIPIIGRLEDIRIEGGKITALPVFDTKDPVGKEAARKWKDGFLHASSIGFRAIKTSTDPQDLKKGQTRATVTKWILRELSFCTLPSNHNAVRLYQNLGGGEALPLALNEPAGKAALNEIIPLINKNKLTMLTKEFALSLGLNEDASQQEILAAILELKSQNDELEGKLTDAQNNKQEGGESQMQQEIDDLKNQLQSQKAETAIDKAIADGKIEETEKQMYLELATQSENGLKTVTQLLDKKPVKTTTLTGAIEQAKKGLPNQELSDTETWDLMHKQKSEKYAGKSALEELKLDNHDEYERLRKAKYGN